MTPIFPARIAPGAIVMDDSTGETITLALNRDATIWLQNLPQRVQVEIGPARKIKSRPLEQYYWSHVISLVQKHQGMTPAEAHRFLLDNCAPRDRFGRPITTSDDDFTRLLQLGYVETCRDFMAREMGIQTMDPDRNWRER